VFLHFNRYRKEEAMKRWSAVFAAAVLVVTLLATSSTSPAMVVYDSFTSAALNPALWIPTGGTYNGGGDLTINLSSSSPFFGINATKIISSTVPFEAQVPFWVGSAAGLAPGSLAYLLIYLGDGGSNGALVAWGQANKFPSGTMTLTGTIFATGTYSPTNAYTTAWNLGTLGIKYNGAGLTEVGYYDIQSSWNLLDTYALATGGVFTFVLQGEIKTTGVGSSSYAFVVPEVRFSSVPIPGVFFLLAPGLAGLALVRRWFRK
jgi:hypothetical protein